MAARGVAITAKAVEEWMADPQAALRQWIIEGLKSKGYGSGKELARRIGIEPEVLSRMKNTDGLKETRRIEAHMIPAIAEYFGSIPPGFEHFTELGCTASRISATQPGKVARRERTMPEVAENITFNISAPSNGTLVIGDHNIITTNNVTHDAALTPEQAQKLDEYVKEVSAARGTDMGSIWRDLCSALGIKDPALITQEAFVPAEKILEGWKEEAIREAVNEKGESR